MDADDLALCQDKLERASTRLSWCLFGFTAVVVIGLVIEVYRPSWIGTQVVAIGVSGELVVEFMAILVDRRLRSTNRKIEEVSTERIAEMQLETERLKAQFAWRTLSSQEIGKLCAVLRSNPGFVSIAHLASDPESQYFSAQFDSAFTDAGWDVCERGSGSLSELSFGIIVISQEGERSAESAALVASALTGAGIDFTVSREPKFLLGGMFRTNKPGRISDSTVEMFIGPRKPPIR